MRLHFHTSRVGKSAILEQYVSRVFKARYKATVGSDFATKQVEVDDVRITMQVFAFVLSAYVTCITDMGYRRPRKISKHGRWILPWCRLLCYCV